MSYQFTTVKDIKIWDREYTVKVTFNYEWTMVDSIPPERFDRTVTGVANMEIFESATTDYPPLTVEEQAEMEAVLLKRQRRY